MYGYLVSNPSVLVLLEPLVPGSTEWRKGNKFKARWCDENRDEVTEFVGAPDIYRLFGLAEVSNGEIE